LSARGLERSGGSIRPRPDGGYSLRIRVEHPDHGRVHRRIALGNKEVADAVREIVDSWRAAYDAPRLEEERRRELQRRYRAKVKALRTTLLAAGGGRHRRRRLAREFDRAAENPWRLCAYLASGSYVLIDVPPGPKPCGALC